MTMSVNERSRRFRARHALRLDYTPMERACDILVQLRALNPDMSIGVILDKLVIAGHEALLAKSKVLTQYDTLRFSKSELRDSGYRRAAQGARREAWG